MYYKKVFYYEETKLPVIKYKDEIWVKANTVANISRYKNTMKSIRDHVNPEEKSKRTVRIRTQIQIDRFVMFGNGAQIQT